MQRNGKGSEKAEGFISSSKNVPFQVVHIKTMYTHEIGQLQEREAKVKEWMNWFSSPLGVEVDSHQ
jgi:hypothetical protein